ncbi:hypothetical protein SBADM41S_01099 [Streptomyces badius]
MLLPGRDHTTDAPESLAQGRKDEINLVRDPFRRTQPGTPRSVEPERVGLVHEDERTELLGGRHDLPQRRHALAHAVHTLEHHQRRTVRRRLLLENRPQIGHVVVPESPHPRTTQTSPVHQRGMTELVHDHNILITDHPSNGPEARGEPRREQAGSRLAHHGGEFPLEVRVQAGLPGTRR